MSVSAGKFEVKKFDCKKNFNLWQKRRRGAGKGDGYQ